MNSEIILCKGIKLDKNYINVLSYGTEAMINLCRQKAINNQYDYSFIRQNKNRIYTNFTYNECLQANYIAFKNPDYSGKWFFAFIDDVVYTGDNNAEIFYTIDVWSTWFSDWQKNKCYVIRQHVNSDKIGEHTVDENLNIGEVRMQNYENLYSLANNFYYIVSSTYDPIEEEDFSGVTQVNGNIFGTKLFAFDSENSYFLEVFLKAVNKAGKIESINSLFIAPAELIDSIGTKEVTGKYQHELGYEEYRTKLINPTSDTRNNCIYDTIQLHKDYYTFDDYTPKNNKLFCYPYNYLFVSNNIGTYNIYKYEDFYSKNIEFELQESLSVGCSIRVVPKYYRKKEKDYDESISLAKYPTGAFSTDSYTNWLTQNAVNIPSKIIGGAVAGFTSGSFVGGAISIAGTVASTIGDFYSASLLPNIEKGTSDGDINFSSKSNSIIFYKMRAKKEYLEIIDNYFTRFGYKINKLETPNIIGRKNWNYVEIGQNESIGYGNVPSNFMEQINNACRKGVTIWHNHDNIGNYNLDNSII